MVHALLHYISRTTGPISCKFGSYVGSRSYMEGIKYVNLIEIGSVVIEIRGAENGELAVPVNNTCESHGFLGR